ncbi:folylpolyglutamate synthase [Schizosaccharomyces japonicus yFS275]|uniref:Folylpolyglutamate synthase n=1 Tax=Schizosaccharomyces japonicus (strain yFS275 / FY16936) TaxID=402676 RepID=B6K3N4_SCHJY|nr:folylpolyglutamate synthase [Schizosaccharomyces japonicus yFS275]EEB08091.1 folylpolyglutamate synthase [Schizosaccharomyces japonicus yFS275]
MHRTKLRITSLWFQTLRRNMSTSVRTYDEAINRLNSLQSNASTLNAIRNQGIKPNDAALEEMRAYFKRLGYKLDDLNRLKIFHVTGTKGKGSTCAFANSILHELQACSEPGAPKRIGVFTSPHLKSICERISIQGSPISQQKFARYFFEVWDRLEATEAEVGSTAKPMYFRYLTLMAFHVFLSENVDTAIFEVGIGGEYDSTNIIPAPVVTGVTSLGIEHTNILGSTLSQIAWQKGGIFKSSAPAFVVPQPVEALTVLQERANERHTTLHVVEAPRGLTVDMLGLAGQHQLQNAALALALVQHYFQLSGNKNINLSHPAVLKGLKDVRWPGRCQYECVDDIHWFLDGAHTIDSLLATGRWLSDKQAFANGTARVLVFNQQNRDDPVALLKAFLTGYESRSTAPPFTHIIFTTNVTWKEQGYTPELLSMNAVTSTEQPLSVQKKLAAWWTENRPTAPSIGNGAAVKVAASIQEALEQIRQIHIQNSTVSVCVTGSLHLVGGLLVVRDF